MYYGDRVNEAKQMFRNLMVGAQDFAVPLAMKEFWSESLERDYGPLDHVYPEPPDPNQRDAFVPRGIRQVIDGDSMVILSDDGVHYEQVRLLGVMAAEMTSGEAGIRDRERMLTLITDAIQTGKRIQFVPDPQQFGRSVDVFGRRLVWLFIDGEPIWYPDELFEGGLPPQARMNEGIVGKVRDALQGGE